MCDTFQFHAQWIAEVEEQHEGFCPEYHAIPGRVSPEEQFRIGICSGQGDARLEYRPEEGRQD